MNLDNVLTQYGLKMKHLVVLDVSFAEPYFNEFASAYPQRYLHLPSHQAIALEVAAGIASLGKLVLVAGSTLTDCDLPDSTLKVKLLKREQEAVWDTLEEGLRHFGTGVLLIPEDE